MSLIMLAPYSQAVKTSAKGFVNVVHLLDRRVLKESRRGLLYVGWEVQESHKSALNLPKNNERNMHSDGR